MQNIMITKIQYQHFETGEFTGIKSRNCEETIRLIQAFPWEQQRDQLEVTLTGPSITIEGPNRDFLKLSLYHQDKFILYYLNGNKKVYARIFNHYTQVVPLIRGFFKTGVIDHTGFARAHFPFQKVRSHFKTRFFLYRPKKAAIFGLLCLWLFFLYFTLVIFSFAMTDPNADSRKMTTLAIVLCFLSVMLIMLTALFVNHYWVITGKILILSRGIDIFYYGAKKAPRLYHKKDVVELVTMARRSVNDHGRLVWVRINFLNGESINISCLLIRYHTLFSKFPGIPQRSEQRLLPFIRSSRRMIN